MMMEVAIEAAICERHFLMKSPELRFASIIKQSSSLNKSR